MSISNENNSSAFTGVVGVSQRSEWFKWTECHCQRSSVESSTSETPSGQLLLLYL